ncbi:hypothetical protein CALCODRAFT_498789 [Calocera cornea HHB12733]|uniref:YetF C-terminal domain-containing protein n=1 Tax=Calocera cornea HHB12733 TaxID=1353952 RepID=A0A165EQ98_9BASI|nr:hypothetical protein CALCODRAFT_498789 [Calocera cornea HHB12733]
MPLLDETDWWNPGDHQLHPIAVGGCIILTTLVYLRLSSNRTMAPCSIYDWVLTVTYGSTLSRIITQPDVSYFRGLLSIFIISVFEHIPSLIEVWIPAASRIFRSKAVCLVFQGTLLEDETRKNRVAKHDILKALRSKGLVSLDECEAVILEEAGTFSIIKRFSKQVDHVPEALSNVDGYVRRWNELRVVPC